MDVFLDIGGLADTEAKLKADPCMAELVSTGTTPGKILFSSPKYLSLDVRVGWLSASIEKLIPPEDGEGLVFEIADWDAPLVGACQAMGVHVAHGQLTTARPAKLQTVRNASSGDAAVGDGLRRQWFAVATTALLEPDHGLFIVAQDGRTLLPNPHSGSLVPDHLAQFALLGRLISLTIKLLDASRLSTMPIPLAKLISDAAIDVDLSPTATDTRGAP